MAIKLSELFAKVLRLESHLAAEAKEELANFKAEVTAQVNTLQAELLAEQGKSAELNSKLTQAQTDFTAASSQIGDIKNSLTEAVAALKLDLKADATPVETISALQGSVATTLAKLNVPAANIPASKPTDTGNTGVKTMTRLEFEALPHEARGAFFKSGGRLSK